MGSNPDHDVRTNSFDILLVELKLVDKHNEIENIKLSGHILKINKLKGLQLKLLNCHMDQKNKSNPIKIK